ncbi:GspE/PulE family protein [Enterobacter sp. CC120223-11]|uniref:GspE/PulE family protein n=1 Tax=Enterobacter sp. CC120223-11 TaxID=1378073 RepID=UPI000BC7D7E4|nr:GspE/PulE family protein [Enterobacter sp. CC120223-11]SNY65716.1 general secretion pathway protein E [Enterobacter sp. CC120223-11]
MILSTATIPGVDTLVALPDEARCQALSELLDSFPDALEETAEALGLIPLPAKSFSEENEDFASIPLTEALSHQALPLRLGDALHVALTDPFSLALRQWAYSLNALPALMSLSALNARLEALGKQQRTLDQLEQQNSDESSEAQWLEITPAAIASEPHAVIKLVNATLFDALQSRASDIHLSAVADGLMVKYRIDGVLHAIRHCAGVQQGEQVISRLKVLSCMDISERRIPQDGRFKALILQRPVDFRVSIVPGIHGEDAVLRVLDKSHDQNLRLETLGFDEHTLCAIRRLTHLPHGMVLVTGPTGSGKSTTLYSALSELNGGESKIITIEDPVEYQLNGVLQIPVNDKKGLTFARGLRAILRHDPDIILVGEIRDGETAGIAVQAALTGHVVLSSVHANDVFSVLERFLYMQVEPASLISALNGVVAQRLVRQICPECGEAAPTPETLPKTWHPNPLQGLTPRWRQGRGCEACRGSGYRGRLALAEVLHFSDGIKEAMLARAPLRQLRQVALEDGFVPLSDIALRAVAEGKTSLEEMNRVIAH